MGLLRDVYGRGAGGLTAAQISEGAGVSKQWVHKLMQGHIANPGVVSIQKVHDFLASRQVRLPAERTRRGAE